MVKIKEQLPSVETEIAKLRAQLEEKEKQLQEQKAVPEISQTKGLPQEKEKIKEAEKAVAEIKTPLKTQAETAPSPLMKDEELVKDLQHVMSMNKPQQVKTLIYLAFKKGVRYSFTIAQQLKSPYLLDEFHDTLVDELYTLLKKKHKL